MSVDESALLKDLRKQVTALEDDLRDRTDPGQEFHAKLKDEYDRAREHQRTALSFGAWRDDRVTQAAVAWILATVFVRFCEDNGLIASPWIAGPGDRLTEADERHQQFFRVHPEKNDRDWLIAAFDHLASTNETVAGLFDRAHNPLWELAPSYEAASDLLKFWRRLDADGNIVHDFTDEEDLDTRFLGDLYQDLSDHAKKMYALLQTPEFVEEFILDLTLEPAVEEFGLEPAWKHKPAGWPGDEPIVRGLRTIDPACGSGHFLLGIFRRLLAKWEAHAPGLDPWDRIRRTLESVHGCDKNPFAAEIARFRLLVAALHAAGETRLDRAPVFPINVAVGDSLLHGRGAMGVQTEVQDGLFGNEEQFTYQTEDVGDFIRRCDLLGKSSYHVVVANPPYITVKDKQEKVNYKKAYSACSGQWTLAVPFFERAFKLSVKSAGEDRKAGFTGQITSNAFMKREFGKKLIEEFLVGVDLSYVIDTSGAFIPEHGTPTIIVIGRSRIPYEGTPVRVVQGIRGEPEEPEVACNGLVWKAIVSQVGDPGSESEWVSVVDWERSKLKKFPWSLSGGGADELFKCIDEAGVARLATYIKVIGRVTHTGADETYFGPVGTWERFGVSSGSVAPVVTGDVVRDWGITVEEETLFPYNKELAPSIADACVAKILWKSRALLRVRREPTGTHEEIGLTWFEWSRWHPERFRIPLGIGMAFVASHPHFALDREGKVFNRTAPAIKLAEGASEDEYYALLGCLNSSVACFWLKQVSHDKGSQGVNEGFKSQEWERFFEFTGTKLLQLPVPENRPLGVGQELDGLAQRVTLLNVLKSEDMRAPTRGSLDRRRQSLRHLRSRMVALQEELDWQTYVAFGLVPENARVGIENLHSVPEVNLGERAFEIVLARKVKAGEVTTSWFERHGSEPVTEIPERWPEEYRRVVQARIDLIEKLPKGVGLIERPEYKRRWATEPWEKKEKAALRNWILDRCEREDLWFGLRDGFRQPRTLTVSQLADQFKDDADMQSVAALYASDHLGKRDLPLAKVLAEIIADEHVPYLAALRYKDTGLRKREEWEQVWELQREEDRTGRRLDIAVPPKYAPKDFQKTSYWSQRGKLDVPKERFISYPGASPDADDSLLLGWAGWDHKDQAEALGNIVKDRTEQAAWDAEKLTPLLAGLLEVLPWVQQWHGEYDAEWEGVPAEEFKSFLSEQLTRYELSEQDLKGWRPPAKGRGRKKA